MDEDKFWKEHPGLKWKGNLCPNISAQHIYFAEQIHETQIDKQKLKENIDRFFEEKTAGGKEEIIYPELMKVLGLK